MSITDEQLIELLEGNKNPELEKAIEHDPALQQRLSELKELLDLMAHTATGEVPFKVKMNVQQAINKQKEKGVKGSFFMQIAAAVTLLVVGMAVGRFILNDTSSATEMASLRQELELLKDVTMTSALQQYSASDRIMAVSNIEKVRKQTNPELIRTLISTLNGDESINVRYAALQAIRNYLDDEAVRYELVKSLEVQNDPLIQISLISMLVEAEERSAIAPLKNLMDNEKITPEVKQQAELAIRVLI